MKKFKNKAERREFLNTSRKVVGVGGIGILLASLAKHDPVFAKLSNNQISNHSDDYMKNLIELSNSKSIKNNDAAFIQTFNSFDKLIKSGNKEAIRLHDDISIQVNSILNSKRFASDRLGLGGLSSQLSNALVGGFLSASDGLKLGPIGEAEMQRILTKSISIEEGFIDSYTIKINSEVLYNYRFSEFINSGTNRLSAIKNISSNKSNTKEPITIILYFVGIAVITSIIHKHL